MDNALRIPTGQMHRVHGPPIIAIDYNGVVVHHSTHPDTGAPIIGALEWLRRWRAGGAELVLMTMRSGDQLNAAIEYLDDNGVRVYGVNEHPHQCEWTDSSKPFAHLYIDDKGVGCPLVMPDDGGRPYLDWEQVGPAVMDAIRATEL